MPYTYATDGIHVTVFIASYVAIRWHAFRKSEQVLAYAEIYYLQNFGGEKNPMQTTSDHNPSK